MIEKCYDYGIAAADDVATTWEYGQVNSNES